MSFSPLVQSKAELYSQFYRDAQAVLDVLNPCDFQKHPDGRVTCRAGQPCCDGCRHISPAGCQVESLACKVWLCWDIMHFRNPALKTSTICGTPASRFAAKLLYQLEWSAEHLEVPMYIRTSKQETFGDALSTSTPS